MKSYFLKDRRIEESLRKDYWRCGETELTEAIQQVSLQWGKGTIQEAFSLALRYQGERRLFWKGASLGLPIDSGYIFEWQVWFIGFCHRKNLELVRASFVELDRNAEHAVERPFIKL